ncbi:MAG: EAL domain-containing protein [Acinetobacter populi]|jgi:EAL domain-containing protein (putative c-di-GMP-specific phosphodiesterase class I)|uniref:EAL domain-containing protein n=1 Tax=Acinetobacter populi TaxID=1582270 RepID=UPI002355C3C0|nr:EAL domain-containing protein [Acinetobacter populi]MCH4248408.1 EAL domain-containing protein [Acinetobacter populi]
MLKKKYFKEINFDRNLFSYFLMNKTTLTYETIIAYYQPIVESVESKDVFLFEALMRWEHERYGTLSADYFIDYFKRNGDILSLGNLFSLRSCQEIFLLNQINDSNASVSINISMRELSAPFFIENFKTMIQHSALSPDLLVIELSELEFIDSLILYKQILYQLKEIGIRISLDNFGYHFSSFSYLLRLPIDMVKIDKQIVHKIQSDQEMYLIISSLINICHNLNIKVIAVGVETETQYSLLKNINCDYYQGYYFSKPFALDLI